MVPIAVAKAFAPLEHIQYLAHVASSHKAGTLGRNKEAIQVCHSKDSTELKIKEKQAKNKNMKMKEEHPGSVRMKEEEVIGQMEKMRK